MGKRGLSRPRRPVQDQGHETVRFKRPAQKLARPEDVLLAGEFRQVAGPHAPRKGRLSRSRVGKGKTMFCLLLKAQR